MRITFLLISLMLVGCSSGSDTADLQSFTDKVLSKPRGRIDPLPEFKPYSAFVYGASGLRSPFESPLVMSDAIAIQSSTVNAPNLNRARQPLEFYSLGELELVGTLAKADGDTRLNALIQTSEANVHTVKVGGYLGKNHGRIIGIKENQLDIIEVVPNGSGGWISRPHTMLIKGSAGDN